MLLIVMGLGLNVSEMVIFLAHQDIVVAIGCFISVCLGSCSFFCTILVAGSPSWIGKKIPSSCCWLSLCPFSHQYKPMLNAWNVIS